MLSSAPANVLEPLGDTTTRQTPKALERQRRTQSVAREPLASEVVAGVDAHPSVQVEATVLDGDLLLVGGLLVVLVGRIGGPRTRERRDLSALHREGGAGVESGLSLRTPFERTLVEVAVAAQPGHCRATGALWAAYSEGLDRPFQRDVTSRSDAA